MNSAVTLFPIGINNSNSQAATAYLLLLQSIRLIRCLHRELMFFNKQTTLVLVEPSIYGQNSLCFICWMPQGNRRHLNLLTVCRDSRLKIVRYWAGQNTKINKSVRQLLPMTTRDSWCHCPQSNVTSLLSSFSLIHLLFIIVIFHLLWRLQMSF